MRLFFYAYMLAIGTYETLYYLSTPWYYCTINIKNAVR